MVMMNGAGDVRRGEERELKPLWHCFGSKICERWEAVTGCEARLHISARKSRFVRCMA